MVDCARETGAKLKKLADWGALDQVNLIRGRNADSD
jgi:hypothetical protein